MALFGNFDFVGMSADEVATFVSAIDTYYGRWEEILNGFNEKADFSIAVKGDVQTAIQEYLIATKELLQAHVSQIKKEKDDINNALAAYQTSLTGIASDVKQKTADIRSAAQNVKID